MKSIKKLFAMGLAVMMALSIPFSVSAAELEDAPIDESRTGSLTIYKYDLTNAEKDGVWDSSYVSTGVFDQSGVNDVLGGGSSTLGNGETGYGYAIKGVEFGLGFGSARLRGSENNDPFTVENGAVVTASNRSGGILGGITTGMPVTLRAAIKPTPSISKPQETVSLSAMENAELVIRGRHDPCIAHRAVPVVEAVTATVLLDLLLEGNHGTF